ncbi:MAG: hypothetical protein V7756_09695 [Halopseudomonas sp.]|uniref:hypothetical protein n=1 Tax=Halopseudomonas sp. TaxID=2901191 RepID=UPI003001B8FF
MEAIVRHERARQAVDAISRDIGLAINRCPVAVKAQSWQTPAAEMDELWDEASGKHKTHLWQALKHREPSDCGYGETGLGYDGIDDALSKHGEYACEHCLAAYRLIVERRHLRRELGGARMSIRALGRAALNSAGITVKEGV